MTEQTIRGEKDPLINPPSKKQKIKPTEGKADSLRRKQKHKDKSKKALRKEEHLLQYKGKKNSPYNLPKKTDSLRHKTEQ